MRLRFRQVRHVELYGDLGPWLRGALLLLTVAPVLLLTGWIALIGFAGAEPMGPAAASIFARIGWLPSMLPPLGFLVLGLVLHGLREEYPGYVLAAGWLLTATVALAAMGSTCANPGLPGDSVAIVFVDRAGFEVDPTVNGQNERVRWARDYELPA